MSLSLHELNAHLLARLLPETHGGEVLDAVKATVKKVGRAAGKAAKTAAIEYTAEQLAILAAAGIEDHTSADPATIKTILGL